ncbi:T9SS type A sorting domain-containing protein [uncultured Kordia sp.]|uniref:T9SS type A sorting domain-containing protein n=1 Tax=uncultured Kordia sp. TaxID=507699 RepID=UPI00262B873F|nr:T9SS type A sorting domain-containing protein [uncultured Kordia sp.]
MKKLLLLIIFCIASTTYAQIINIPDANFKARLLAAESGNGIAYGVTGSSFRLDANNNGEIEVSEALLVGTLQLGFSNISDLTGIEYFTNLGELNCRFNNLTTVDFSSLPNLEFVNINDNNITSVNISGLTNLEYFNISNNQLTSIDLSGLTSLRSILVSGNQISTLDTQGLTVSRIECSGNLLTTLDTNHLTGLTLLKCDDNLLESLFIKNGSFERFGSSFSGNPTLRYICADVEQFGNIQERVTDYGYTNCVVNSLCSYVSGQNFSSISGQILYDEGSDGCDSNDVVYPNLEFTLSDGTNTDTTFSDASGNYNFNIQDGTYTVTPAPLNPTYFSFSPTSITTTFPDDASPNIQDFCVTPNGVFPDLEVTFMSAGVNALTGISYPITNDYPLSFLDSDQTFSFRIVCENKGTTTQSGTLYYGYNITEILSITTTPMGAEFGTGGLSWDFADLKPFETFEVLVVLNFTTQHSYTFNHSTIATSPQADVTLGNNEMMLTHDVFCCLLDTPELSFKDYFTMYPNPTREKLYLKLKQDLTISSFTIYNMFGQKVKTIPYKNTELTSIDVTDLKSGQYFIRIATDKTLLTTRFMKQ